jgi:hypothetical protein
MDIDVGIDRPLRPPSLPALHLVRDGGAGEGGDADSEADAVVAWASARFIVE